MIISDFAIKRPVVTVVTMLALVVFGLFALFSLDVDEFPDISAPIIFIAVPYPGASPGQVEREVIERMEEAINSISGVDRITSTSSDGFGQIIVQFVFSKAPDQASQDVRDAISGIRDRLPTEMREPLIRKFDPNDLPIVSLVIQSQTMHPAELTLLADPGVTKELRAIPGVAQVTVVGGIAREIAVKLDPSALRGNGVSVSQVVGALQAQNLSAPVGRVNAEFEEQTIRLQGRLQTVEEFRQVVVATRGGQLIRLDDVADVADTAAEVRSLGLYNGIEAVGIDITKSKGASTATVANEIKAAVGTIQKRLPAGTKISVVKDAGARVEASVRNVQEALIEGAFLTVIVVFLFLNSWRSTVITGLALPVSTIAAFIAVQAFGFTLNTMSLLGLSLAIGILIDDAIVVRENIVRHVELGLDHVTASHKGTSEIGLAVAATTFSIVAVFVPIGFMEGIAGQWFKPFALTIACAVLVSLFVSFSLDPMLSAYWPDPEIEEGEHRNPIARALVRFNAWFDRMAERYRGVIAWALDHRWTMIAIAVVSFILAIGLQVIFGGGGFAPVSDRSEFTINLETPPGSSMEYTRLKAEEIGRILRAHKEVAYTYTSIGTASGSGAVDLGTIYVRLVPKKERTISQQELSARVRREIRGIGGATASVASGGFGGNQKQISIEVRGENEADMNAAAEAIAAAIAKVGGAVDVGLSTRGQKPEIEIEMNRSLIGTMGLTVGQVAQSLRPAFAGLDVGDWVDPTGRTRDVVVRLEAEARRNVADLVNLPLVVAPTGGGAPTGPGATGAPVLGGAGIVPLGQIATVRQTVGPASIDHLDRDRVITVGANVEGRSLSEVSQDVNRRIAAIDIPPGVQITQGGEVKNQAEVFTSILAALGLAVLLMYLILVVQFGSFLDPLAIMISLPLSLIGVVLALLATGDTLNIMSLIGVILLMGIVAKNAILLIDFAKAAHEEGLPLREALIEAGRVRLRPIMMTTLALIAGMIPVAIGAGEGADFRAPLGRAVIGGTITSTLLTLLVIPTIYEIFDEWRAWFRRKFRSSSGEHGAAGEPAVARSPE
jgi:hydrophobic/amphiphilic exporter-1 (mainly G- bacteria), HAE1 family